MRKECRDTLVAELCKGERSGVSKRRVPEVLAAAKRARSRKIRRLREAIAVGIADHQRGDCVEVRSRSALREVTQQLGRPAKSAAKPAR